MEVTKSDILRALIEERDHIRNEYSHSIATMLTPITLTALFELFELDHKLVEWGAFDIVENSLVIVVKLTYTTDENTPEFLKMMDVISNAGATARVRTIKLGLPLDIVFSSKEAIKEYMVTSATNMLKVPEKKTQTRKEQDFDPTKLSADQLEQLKLFQVMRQAGEKQ